MILLIHPPVCKPGEAPAGLAKLTGALERHGVPHRVIDASLEGLLYLLQGDDDTALPGDTWTRRAFRHRLAHLEALRAWPIYGYPDRYRRAVHDLARVLDKKAASPSICLGLANYEDSALSPLRRADLLRASEEPEVNPFYRYFRSRLLSVLEERLPDMIGFSLNYLSQALCTFAMIGLLRRVVPSVKIVLGGGLVTSWLKHLRGMNPFAGLVDLMVDGPGEALLLEMAGRPREGASVCPHYGGFPLMDYLSPGMVLPYGASRGCYWQKCSFCPETAEGNAYEHVPPHQVMADLQTLTALHKPALIHFLDNAMSPVLLKALAGGELGVPWYGFVRMTGHLADPGFCLGLRRSGCVMLKLGLESGSQAVLDRLHKGIDLPKASVILRNLKAAGIGTYVYLLFGTPAETLEDAGKTLDFVVRHGRAIDFLNPAIFNLPVHAAEGLDTRPFYDGDLSLYRNFNHPEGWDRSRIRHFLDRTFKRHPVVAAILKNDPPVFTSNHAPFVLRGRAVSQE